MENSLIDLCVGREKPQIEIIFQACVGHTQTDNRFVLLGDYGVYRIDTQRWRRDVFKKRRKLHEFCRWRNGIAVANVELHLAARNVQFAGHRHAHTRIVGILASPCRLHADLVEDHAIVRRLNTDLLKNFEQVVNFGRPEAKQVDITGRLVRLIEPQVEKKCAL
jgi:hypothetical protein